MKTLRCENAIEMAIKIKGKIVVFVIHKIITLHEVVPHASCK